MPNLGQERAATKPQDSLPNPQEPCRFLQRRMAARAGEPHPHQHPAAMGACGEKGSTWFENGGAGPGRFLGWICQC